jgi:hypothetical protein
MIDAMHLKAHRTAASLLKKGMFPAVSGRTKGGLNSKSVFTSISVGVEDVIASEAIYIVVDRSASTGVLGSIQRQASSGFRTTGLRS